MRSWGDSALPREVAAWGFPPQMLHLGKAQDRTDSPSRKLREVSSVVRAASPQEIAPVVFAQEEQLERVSPQPHFVGTPKPPVERCGV
uniref:Uncharacterized protein n=1 Tax=Tolypothrix bouteillei VB521301 TaxID=1479485 RepID=A0A0C1N295_9CYAN